MLAGRRDVSFSRGLVSHRHEGGDCEAAYSVRGWVFRLSIFGEA